MALWRLIKVLSVGAVLVAPIAAEAAPRAGHNPGSSEWRHGDDHRGHRHGGFVRHHPHHRHHGHGSYVHRHWRRPFHIGFAYSYPNFHYNHVPYPVYADSGYGVRVFPNDRPNYAGRGLLLGALAGGILGNNSGDLGNSTWRGAALGAAAGYIAGSVAESRARSRENVRDESSTTAYSADISPTATTSVPAAEPAQNEPMAHAAPRPESSMASANRLFGR
jgi:hypothetical protein